jgi:hypothetical protein
MNLPPTDDYNRVRSASIEEFKAAIPDELNDPTRFTKSDPEDVARMERLLDLRPGTLAYDEHYLERSSCSCGRVLTMYDFVFTGLVDAGHSRAFIVQVFLGSKRVLNAPRVVRCSSCGSVERAPTRYFMGYNYGCGKVGPR